MLEELSKEEFNEFSRNYDQGTFFQSSYWGELKKSNGWIPYIVGIKEKNNIKGATLLLAKKIPLFKKYIYYAPRGFLLDYNDVGFLKQFTKEITKYMKKKGGIFLKINPYMMYQERDVNGDIVHQGEEHKDIVNQLEKLGYKHNGLTITYGKDLEPRWLSVLDLRNKTEEEILKNMDRMTRWTINNSYKHGLKLVEIDESRIHEYKKLMEHTGERRGFIDRPLEYYQKMYECFSKHDEIKIMLVELDPKEYLESLLIQEKEVDKKIMMLEEKNNPKSEGKIRELKSQKDSLETKLNDIKQLANEYKQPIVIAGGVFMTFGKQVISLFGASYREFMKYNGQYFLNYEMIKYALNHHYEAYNFFGITGEFHQDSEMYGLFDFKKGFNAVVVELIGEFNLVVNQPFNTIYELMYFVYRKMKR